MIGKNIEIRIFFIPETKACLYEWLMYRANASLDIITILPRIDGINLQRNWFQFRGLICKNHVLCRNIVRQLGFRSICQRGAGSKIDLRGLLEYRLESGCDVNGLPFGSILGPDQRKKTKCARHK